ncbi:DHHC palmitoyltransferase-domain-containing protein [Cladochytrium replicatum]|nr:DHHC palmitoyltransferase-domain-containing protein [Cladochytrium replicatum]
MPRRNGWECVWNIQQILSMLLLFSSAGFYAFIYIAATRTNFDEPRQSPWTKTVGSLMLFGAAWLLLLTSVLILAAGILIGSNPADPLIQKEISGESTPQAYCTICNKHVHPTSLHCKYCDKCVLRMDHHCFFVNNCIGKRNYRLYIAVMILTLVYLVSNCFGSVLIFIFHYTAASILSSIAETYSLDDRALQAACGCFAVLFAIFSLFLGDLLRLHWVLCEQYRYL